MNNFKLFDSLLRKGSWYASSIINNNINWIWLELPIAIFSDNVTSFSATILVLLSHFVSINFFFWRSFFSFFFFFFCFPGLFHLSARFLSLFWHVSLAQSWILESSVSPSVFFLFLNSCFFLVLFGCCDCWLLWIS